MLYSKCLEVADYNLFSEHIIIDSMITSGKKFRYEHPHRKWEYGLALKLINDNIVSSVLNVGGGNSPLSTAIANTGIYVTEIDPDYPSEIFDGITYLHEPFPSKGLKGKFDAVISTSVIEHVQDDLKFFTALLKQSSNLVFLTTDFHNSGNAISRYHIRTYNKSSMLNLVRIAESLGFSTIGDYNYDYNGDPLVYEYTFASLALKRNDV